VRRAGLSKVTPGLLEDTLHHAARAACDPAHSATSALADSHGAFRHAGSPASAAEDFTAVEDSTVADLMAAGTANQLFVIFPVDDEIQNGDEDLCGEQSLSSADFHRATFPK